MNICLLGKLGSVKVYISIPSPDLTDSKSAFLSFPSFLILFTSEGNQIGIPSAVNGVLTAPFATTSAISFAPLGINKVASPAPMAPKKLRLVIFGPPLPSLNPMRPPFAFTVLPAGNNGL